MWVLPKDWQYGQLLSSGHSMSAAASPSPCISSVGLQYGSPPGDTQLWFLPQLTAVFSTALSILKVTETI